jgi:hypothetical protein
MSKYSPLGEFLQRQRAVEISMTFTEIERMIDAKLPASSLQYQPWWANDPSHVQGKVWLDAGFRTEQVDLGNRKVVFRRVDQSSIQPPASRKGGRHPIFGAMKGVAHVPEGTDLTEPADPDWGKVNE